MSSKKLASLLIRISANGADARAALMDVSEHLADLGKKAEKVGKKLTKTLTVPLTAIAAASVKLADTQVQAEAKLLTALQGREAVQQRLIAQAGELQSRTTLGDEAIIEQQAFLAALGQTESQIGDTINAAVQLSAALGISLESAVKNLAKTYGGMTGELGESIPALKNLTKEQLMAGEAISFVNENYKGFAETAATTGMGPLVQLKNTLGDLAEQIGVIVLPAVQTLAKWMKSLAEWFQNFPAWLQETIVIIGALAAAIGPLSIAFGKFVGVISGIPIVIKAIAAAFTLITAHPIVAAVSAAIAALGALIAWLVTRYQKLKKERAEVVPLLEEDQRKLDETYKELAKDGLSAAEAASLIKQRREAEAKATEQAAEANEHLAESIEEVATVSTTAPTPKITPVSGIATDGANLAGLGGSVVLDTDKLNEQISATSTFSTGLAQMRADMGTAVEDAQQMNVYGEALGGLLNSSVDMLSEAFASIGKGQKFDPFANIIKMLGSALENLGKMLIAVSGIMDKIKAAIKALSINPYLAAAIGVTAIALGATMRGYAEKKLAEVPALASGGLAYGPTLAVVGDNRGASHDPEVIAPLSKLRQYMGAPSLELVGDVEFRVDGDGLRAVLNRANTRLKYR
jgi:hypothetical protein